MNFFCRFRFVSLCLLGINIGRIAGEEPDPSLLTLDRIYKSKEFDAEPFRAKWLKEGSGYTTLEPSKVTAGGKDIVRYDPESGAREVLVPAAHLIPSGENKPLPIDDYAWSAKQARVLIYTNSKRVWRQNTRGDYWVLDRASRELRQLGGKAQPATLMFATFSPAGDQVAYVRENNIYVEDLRSRNIRALTTDGSSDIINGTFDWVYEEEFGLRKGFRWSPDSQRIAYWQINSSGVRAFPLVNTTDSLYPRITLFKYPKTGEKNSLCRIGVMSATGGATRWMNVPGDARNHYIARMNWAASSEELVLFQLNRLQNINRVMLANALTGVSKTIWIHKDAAWVDVHDEMMWIDKGNQFTWIGEGDGWRQLYLHSRDGTRRNPITPSEYDAIRLLAVEEQAKQIYFLASPDNATQRYLYRAKLDGSEVERVTPLKQPGTHSYQISPDTKWAIHTYSHANNPPIINLVRLPDHKPVRTLVENKKLREKFGKLRKEPMEFFRVNIGDDVELDGWCLKPPGFDPKKKYPLLIYVYGEPAGQTVLDRWGSRHFLWHLLLAQRGYVIMSIDNRGTPAPRGRAWRKYVYRKIGILAPQDQAAALQAMLKQRPYLDPKRVGIWGWSGGGSMSLNAIFKYPDLYKTAISVAPVPNQRYYDTIYQERYMGLPSDNVEGYMKGSAINYAHQLKGNLLLIHGTGDDNCHYQGMEALINTLIRHNKSFQMMAYPNRSHSIREGANTTRHLRTLMTRYLMEKMPPNP